MKKLILAAAIMVGFNAAQAQNPDENGSLVVKSSVVCEMCKNTIENGIAFDKGIKRVHVDVTNNVIAVKYSPKKTSAETIKQRIADLGYVAGDVHPTQQAVDNLHECCKPGAHSH